MAKWIDIMSEREVRMVHDNSLRILSEIGIKVPNTEILRRCREFGAEVDDGAFDGPHTCCSDGGFS
jgi:trimethylamine:corrinoid methyltransferase-like protein